MAACGSNQPKLDNGYGDFDEAARRKQDDQPEPKISDPTPTDDSKDPEDASKPEAEDKEEKEAEPAPVAKKDPNQPEGSTAAEWKRFLDARNGNVKKAKTMLDTHLKWRKERLPKADEKLGEMITPLKTTTKEGRKVCYLLGAMYDTSAGSAEDHSLAVAGKLDSLMARDSDERFVILLDVRGGKGLPNPSAWTALGLLRKIANMLPNNFPERLHRLVIFPMPSWAMYIWTIVKSLLDKRTADKIKIVPGPCSSSEPVPEDVGKFVSDEILEEADKERKTILEGRQK